jgi:hypothetical protein
MNKEQFQDAWHDDLLEVVEEKVDNGWRHGTNNDVVFELFNYDEETDDFSTTGTYWKAYFRVSGDGEYHGIREGDFEFYQVWPKEVIIKKTVYSKEKPVDETNSFDVV